MFKMKQVYLLFLFLDFYQREFICGASGVSTEINHLQETSSVLPADKRLYADTGLTKIEPSKNSLEKIFDTSLSPSNGTMIERVSYMIIVTVASKFRSVSRINRSAVQDNCREFLSDFFRQELDVMHVDVSLTYLSSEISDDNNSDVEKIEFMFNLNSTSFFGSHGEKRISNLTIKKILSSVENDPSKLSGILSKAPEMPSDLLISFTQTKIPLDINFNTASSYFLMIPSIVSKKTLPVPGDFLNARKLVASAPQTAIATIAERDLFMTIAFRKAQDAILIEQYIVEEIIRSFLFVSFGSISELSVIFTTAVVKAETFSSFTVGKNVVVQFFFDSIFWISGNIENVNSSFF